jgi:hypothetical protein
MALIAAPVGGAKGPSRPVRGTVCGPAGCEHVASFSLQLAGSYSFYRNVTPAPFFVVRFDLTRRADISAAGPILYVPLKRIWRVTIDGTPVWLDVPWRDDDALRRAVRHLRPYSAPRSWAAVTLR